MVSFYSESLIYLILHE